METSHIVSEVFSTIDASGYGSELERRGADGGAIELPTVLPNLGAV